MWISDISIRRPVFATMVIMSFMVLGIVSMTRLGIDLFPEVNFPFVNISVVYPGASPEEVETLVTRPIEDAVAGINGVKRVISSSTESRALRRAGAAPRSRSAGRRRGSPREGRRHPQPAARADRRSDDRSLRRGGAPDHDVRRRVVAAFRHHAAADRRRPQAAPRADRRRRGGGSQRRRGARDPGRSRSRAGSKRWACRSRWSPRSSRRRTSTCPAGRCSARGRRLPCAPRANSQTVDEIEQRHPAVRRRLDGPRPRRRARGRRLRRADVDDAAERRGRRVVLDQEAVGREHRGDCRARSRHARPRAAELPGSPASTRSMTTPSSSARTSRRSAKRSSSAR